MRNVQTKIFSILFSMTLFGSLISCEGPGSNNAAAALLGLDIPASATKAEALTRYADLAYESYNQAATDATSLLAALTTFTTTPNETNLTAARNAWVVARSSYLVTEAFRFSNGPIDADPGFCGAPGGSVYSGTDECEGAINAWPLDEVVIDNYINSLSSAPTFADIYAKNGDSTLASGSEGDTEKVVMTGYHAIEYLLWGQDNLSGGDNSTPGQRAATDFSGAGVPSYRRAYILAVTQGVIGHLQQIRDQWDPAVTSGIYRTDTFLASGNTDTSLKNIFDGLTAFMVQEWGGDRLSGVDSELQEDEHSCFSDTTKADFYYDAQGVYNIWTGHYSVKKGVNISTGAGLVNLLSSKNQGSVTSEIESARNTFCINLSNETTDPNYTASCPSGSLSHRYDQVIMHPTDSQHSVLENVGLLINTTLAQNVVRAKNVLGL
ncbi:imelysin [Leptospira hartskeerlii]|uniref:Imelysin n=1 Tax=Leptospira hartskeerlii TaxID=2023177 RepID=A0A2M9XE42_9LEPT|nr:imelysin family protein [Leptospira hartskeerlii]PJZ25956.1 imelysin [Leptospira hartskeerlii]PJZ35592.1 imelysin [Leptospira hartskeerlii]